MARAGLSPLMFISQQLSTFTPNNSSEKSREMSEERSGDASSLKDRKRAGKIEAT